ncbi:MAG: YcbK family protein [Deltaproteobacteria bacterium]|nr:YcbK family protein [Deltaproteobacteria bacterium]
MRRALLVVAAALAFAFVGAVDADAKPRSKAKAAARDSTYESAKRLQKSKGTRKECGSRNGKRRCKRVAMFQGHNANKSTLRTEALAKPSGDVWLRAENLAEETKVNIYKADGSFDDAALAKLDNLFRCRQTGEVRAVRTELYEQLSRIYDHFGGRKVVLISGFRFAERNSSRHFHASAMDIRIQDVSIREMYSYAESLDGGDMGIGIYPTSNFIHVDYRAPGEPSYRWTDWSGPGSGKKGKKSKKKSKINRTQPARKPVS